jgi:hypothetical protein
MIIGRSAATFSAIKASDVEQALGGLRAESKHAAVLCIDGLRAVLRELAARSW